MTTYVATIRPDGTVSVNVDGPEGTEVEPPFEVRPGRSLRAALAERGWEPTGQRARGGGWAAIVVRRRRREPPSPPSPPRPPRPIGMIRRL